MKQKPPKKRLLRILLVLVLVLLTALAVWQRNNLLALWTFLTHDAGQVDEMLREQESEIDEKLRGIEQSGEDPADSGGTEPSAPGKTPQRTPDFSAQKARINAIIDEIYGLRSEYTAELESMHQDAVHEFWHSGEITADNKQKIAKAYIDRAVAMEKTCDGQMKALLSELKGLLKEIGGDADTVNDIAYMYSQEKQLKKAQLMEILNADPNRNAPTEQS